MCLHGKWIACLMDISSVVVSVWFCVSVSFSFWLDGADGDDDEDVVVWETALSVSFVSLLFDSTGLSSSCLREVENDLSCPIIRFLE